MIARTRTPRPTAAFAVAALVALGLAASEGAALAAREVQNPATPSAATTTTRAAGTLNRTTTPVNPFATRTTTPSAPAVGANAPATRVPTTPLPATGTRTAPPASTFAGPGSTIRTTPVLPKSASPLTTTRVGAGTVAKPKSGGRRISPGAAIIAALAALLVLGAAAWALARRFAYEPAWWLGMRHSFAEASFRTSATWAELRDWARIGR